MATTTFALPIGTIMPFGGPMSSDLKSDLENKGFLFCNGEQINRKDYKSLFAVIGNAYGDGDGRSTFNLPDLRGVFLRGCDNGRGKDPDANERTASGDNGNKKDNVGSYQTCAIQKHTHFVGYVHWRSFKGEDGTDKPIKDSSGAGHYTSNDGGGVETRPVNVYVNYIIYAGLEQ